MTGIEQKERLNKLNKLILNIINIIIKSSEERSVSNGAYVEPFYLAPGPEDENDRVKDV